MRSDVPSTDRPAPIQAPSAGGFRVITHSAGNKRTGVVDERIVVMPASPSPRA